MTDLELKDVATFLEFQPNPSMQLVNIGENVLNIRFTREGLFITYESQLGLPNNFTYKTIEFPFVNRRWLKDATAFIEKVVAKKV